MVNPRGGGQQDGAKVPQEFNVNYGCYGNRECRHEKKETQVLMGVIRVN